MSAQDKRMREKKEVVLGTVPLVGMQHCLQEEEWPPLIVTVLENDNGLIQLDLYRDPTNFYDKDAIKVVYEDQHIGWVPRSENRIYAKLMDGKLQLIARVDHVTKRQYRKPGEPYVFIDLIWVRDKTEAELAKEVQTHAKRRKRVHV